jgi:hypothetical protein
MPENSTNPELDDEEDENEDNGCSLRWVRSFDLNFQVQATSGLVIPIGLNGRFKEYKKGPFEEASFFSTNVLAIYGKLQRFGQRTGLSPRRQKYIKCEEVKYSIDLTNYQRTFDINFNENTGIFSGVISDIDAFIEGSSDNSEFGPEDFFATARAPNPRKVFFDIKAYVPSQPSISISDKFSMEFSTSWDSKRRALLLGPRSINSEFYIDGKKATKEQYFSYLKRNRFI